MGVASSKIDVVPVPIDTDTFWPGKDEREGVLFVGRAHDPRKNLPLLLRAFSTSEELGRHVLNIVSSGPPVVVPTTVPRIKWWGGVDDLAARYRAAAVLAVPSVQEGLGIVAFEAMSCGTPVVVARCGGPEEWVAASGGGLIVEDEKGMAKGLLKILSDPTMAKEMGEAGREWVLEKASTKNFIDDSSIFVLQ